MMLLYTLLTSICSMQEGVTAFDVASVYNHDSVMKELEKYALGSDVASDVTLPAASTAAAEPPFTETQHTMSSQSRQTVQKRVSNFSVYTVEPL